MCITIHLGYSYMLNTIQKNTAFIKSKHLIWLELYLPEVHPLVMAKLSISHVSMVPDDLADMFRWHVFFLSIHKAKLSLFGVALCLQVLPFSCCKLRKNKTITKVIAEDVVILRAASSEKNIPFS